MMLKKFTIALVAGAVALVATSQASADVMGVLVSGQAGGGGSGVSSWTSVLPGSTIPGSSGYTRGAGLTNPAGTFTNYTVAGVAPGGSEATSIGASDFITWGLNWNAAWNLDDFEIRFGRSSTGPNAMSIQLAVATTVGGAVGAFTTIYTDAGGVVQTGEEHTVSLASFDNVTKVLFRAVIWSATNTTGQFNFQNSANINSGSFILNASAVPEPATLGLLGLAGLALLRRRHI